MIRSLRFTLVASALAAAGPWAPALGLDSGAGAPPACAASASGVEGNAPLASSALAAPRASAASGWLAAEPERTGGRSNESGPRPCRTGARVLAEPSSGVRPGRTPLGAALPRAASGLLGLVSAPANAPPGS